MKTNKKETKWHVLLWVIVIIEIFPLLFMISTSFKPMNQVFTSTLNIIPTTPTFKNYKYIVDTLPILNYVGNTFIIAAVVTIGKTVTSILAAYVFVYKDFKGKNILYSILLLTMFVPFTVTMIPNYIIMSNAGLLNSNIGVVLPQLADALGIFLMRQSMRTVPKSLIEVAKLEKVPEIKILSRIILPLIRNSIMSMGIIFFINSWNEYFWPMLILKNKDKFTLPLALQLFISSEGGNDWGVAMAVACLTVLLPLVLYIICQRFIINTFMNSGIKG
ncbi:MULTISPECIES: carbohydrate ABC transporter permease [Clostridium]|jgi:sn-glycerol 3-phosphate transport system permease protein|uniref:carbohydrate ABC transporter permease n=1 Tax=Clostridium TaxID=1485 RepID=UPI000289C430|nr:MULTISPECIES: carbohydrate ABC transporter permease [Clostridium]MDF2503292.1 ABC-type sugar transport system, permease component [Clostridium sp.]